MPSFMLMLTLARLPVAYKKPHVAAPNAAAVTVELTKTDSVWFHTYF